MNILQVNLDGMPSRKGSLKSKTSPRDTVSMNYDLERGHASSIPSSRRRPSRNESDEVLNTTSGNLSIENDAKNVKQV